MYPLDALEMAGVDLTTPQAVQSCQSCQEPAWGILMVFEQQTSFFA